MCAYYTAQHALTAGELREELSRQIPSYMIPAYFVQLEEMPLTFNGKIDRKSLPSPRENLTGMNYEAPRTELEKILAAVWESVLGLERVGISDHFFELGAIPLSRFKYPQDYTKPGISLKSNTCLNTQRSPSLFHT